MAAIPAPTTPQIMIEHDHRRIIQAVDFWIKTKLEQHDLLRGYVFLMEVTPAVQSPVGISSGIGHPDPIFEDASYLERMAIMCERLRDDGLYDLAWALGVVRDPVGLVEPRASVNWDRFKSDLRQAVSQPR